MSAHVVAAEDVDESDGGWDRSIQEFQEVDELHHSLAGIGLPVGTPCTGIESGEEVQRPRPPVLMFDFRGTTRLGGTCGRGTGTGLDRGLFIDRKNEFVGKKRAGV